MHCRTPGDVDVFSFSAPVAGTATLRLLGMPAWGTAGRSNLNGILRVMNATGAVLANASGVGIAPFNASLPAPGTYYVSVTPSGEGSPSASGYTAYGSRGQYMVTITFPTVEQTLVCMQARSCSCTLRTDCWSHSLVHIGP